MLRTVLLPDPDGPSSATNSPGLIENDTSFTASRTSPPSWNDFDSPGTSTLSSAAVSRDTGALSGRIRLARRVDELGRDHVVDGHRLDAGELAEPDLRSALEPGRVDDAVVIGDLLHQLDLEQVRLLRG